MAGKRRAKLGDSRKRLAAKVRQIIAFSDTHYGDKLAICPSGFLIDEGVPYQPSKFQKKIEQFWEIFWGEWVPHVTRGEPFAVVLNGDCIEGNHHRNTTTITPDLSIHRKLAIQMLKPVVAQCDGLYYHIRGTDSHVGPSGQEEESVAEALGAIPDEEGRHARHELWKQVGTGLVHFLHHVGTTSSAMYESTAVHRELVNAFVEAGQWGDRPPDIVVRSHRHRAIRTVIPSWNNEAMGLTTPAWQGKTPYTFRKEGARQGMPQLGGWLIRQGDEVFYARPKIWRVERPKPE